MQSPAAEPLHSGPHSLTFWWQPTSPVRPYNLHHAVPRSGRVITPADVAAIVVVHFEGRLQLRVKGRGGCLLYTSDAADDM
eukprot:15431484-Alexandrium_andersonii.AAC.1